MPLGEKFVYATYSVVTAASCTMSIFNTDLVPFFVSISGLKIGFDGIVAIKEANSQKVKILNKRLGFYGTVMLILAYTMSTANFGYICSQYENPEDPCAGINIFKDTTANQTSCSSIVMGSDKSILRKCKTAIEIRTILFFIVSGLCVIFSTLLIALGFSLNSVRANKEDPTIDTDVDIADGNIIRKGSSFTITWDALNVYNCGDSNVDIILNGSSDYPIVANTSDGGNHTWTIGLPESERNYLRG